MFQLLLNIRITTTVILLVARDRFFLSIVADTCRLRLEPASQSQLSSHPSKYFFEVLVALIVETLRKIAEKIGNAWSYKETSVVPEIVRQMGAGEQYIRSQNQMYGSSINFFAAIQI